MPAITGLAPTVPTPLANATTLTPLTNTSESRAVRLDGRYTPYDVSPLPKGIGTSAGLRRILSSAGYDEHEMGGIAAGKGGRNKRSTTYWTLATVKLSIGNYLATSARCLLESCIRSEQVSPPDIDPAQVYIQGPCQIKAAAAYLFGSTEYTTIKNLPERAPDGSYWQECNINCDIYYHSRTPSYECTDRNGKKHKG
jgi:hypothetical protein